MADEITTQILIEIRDEVRGINASLDETNGRLDVGLTSVDERVDGLQRDMDRRFSIATALLRGIDARMGKLETEMTFLPRRVDVLEQKVAALEDEQD